MQSFQGAAWTPAMVIIFAGLVGGILWNLLTWLLGLPSSSSHALFGGLIGAGIAGAATVNWPGILGKIIIPAVLSPVIAGLVAAIGTWLVYRLTRTVHTKHREAGFRWGQIGTASLVSLAHGTGDAQKTMGVIALALIAHGTLTGDQILTQGLPIWIIITCGAAIALGTYLGGWRIIRTLGKGLVDITPRQGMAGDGSTAAVILASSHLGFALSTTHVATGSVVGAGLGRGTHVRWGVVGRMLVAWLLTFPAAGLVAALVWWVGDAIGGAWGATVIFVGLCAGATYLFRRSRHQAVGAHNVNDEWDRPQDTLDQHAPAGKDA